MSSGLTLLSQSPLTPFRRATIPPTIKVITKTKNIFCSNILAEHSIEIGSLFSEYSKQFSNSLDSMFDD